MAIVKTRVGRLGAAGTMWLMRNVVTKMTGNASFAAPTPALAALTSAANTLEAAVLAANAARSAALEATSHLHFAQAVANALLAQEAAYVQNASAGNASVILSSGFAVRNAGSPVGALPAPEFVSVDVNGDPGTMSVRWHRVPGAASYAVQWALGSEAEEAFVAGANSTSTRARMTGLTSGSRYYVRVAAIGAAGTGQWSVLVEKVAP